MASETRPPKQTSTTTTTTTSTTTTHIGVLLLPPVQLLDLSAVDLLGMLSPSYLQACPLPAALIALAHPVQISYICASGPNTLAAVTASCSINVTHGLSSPDVQPGKLDVLMIPGPDPNGYPSAAEKAFMRGHASDPTCDVLTVCTGVKPAACAGILDGKTVTGPRALVGQWSKEFPGVRWVEKRWCRDGRVWTSAGVTNGQDMVAAYLHEKFQPELADLVCAMAEVGDRGQEYDKGKVSNASWWVWLIFRSWWKGKSDAKVAFRE